MTALDIVAAVIAAAMALFGLALFWRQRPGRLAPAEPETAQETPMAGKFEVYRDKAREWRWRLRAANGRIIADSGEGYKQRARCLSGLAAVQRVAPAASVVTV
jgi:uncharacterized protein